MSGKKKAFTLIELLVVIAIIGILATISVLALQNARAKSRDAKRAGDMKQVQTALELFFNDNNRYPTSTEWATGKIFSTSTIGTSTYMQIIPSASTPVDGNCTSDQNTFSYVQTENGNSYNISFCLGNTTGTLTPGPKCLTPGGIVDVDCSGGGGGGPIGDSFSCPGDPVVQYDGGSYDSDGLSSTTGGYYRTVQIGTQCWLRENLKTTKYNDNTPILNLTDESDWANNTTGAYSCFNNSTANCDTYGALYNFYAVDFASNGGKNLCPSGWRVPSRTDWNNLYIFLGSDAQVGYKLKSSDDWDGNNSSGFSALPTGFRDFEGSFDSTNAYFWSASIMDASKAWFRVMQTGSPEFNETYDMFGYGFPIRCLED